MWDRDGEKGERRKRRIFAQKRWVGNWRFGQGESSDLLLSIRRWFQHTCRWVGMVDGKRRKGFNANMAFFCILVLEILWD